MSARLLKKVLKEQEQQLLQNHAQHVETHQQYEDEDDEDEDDENQQTNGNNSVANSSINPFDLLNDDDHDSDQVLIPILNFIFPYSLLSLAFFFFLVVVVIPLSLIVVCCPNLLYMLD